MLREVTRGHGRAWGNTPHKGVTLLPLLVSQFFLGIRFIFSSIKGGRVPLGPPVYMHTAHACDVCVASSLEGLHFKDTGFYILHYVACQISGPAINIITWVELSPLLPPSYSSHMAVDANNAKNVTPEFPRIR